MICGMRALPSLEGTNYIINFNAFSIDLNKQEKIKMANFSVRVFDKNTASEIDSVRVGFADIKDREHYGRKFITVATEVGDKIEHRNVGILNPDGSIEPQPGYDFKVERD